MSRSRRRPLLAALAVATALAAASCGVDTGDGDASALITGGSGGSAGTGAAPAAGSFEGTGGAVSLSKAAEATAAVGSYKVAMEITIDGVPGVGSAAITSEGEFDVEARRGRLTTDLGSLIGMFEGPTGESMAGEMDVVVDGDTVYVRSPLFTMFSEGDEDWVSLPAAEMGAAGGVGSGTTSDPGAFLAFLEGAGTVEELGTEEVRGVATTHVRADLELAKVLEQAPAEDGEDLTEQLEGLGLDPDQLGTVPAEAWIDGDGHVRRFTMTYDLGALGDEEAEGVSTTIDVELYDFDEPVEIELPDPSEVGELDPSMLPDSGD